MHQVLPRAIEQSQDRLRQDFSDKKAGQQFIQEIIHFMEQEVR
jgi:hypothetical protein